MLLLASVPLSGQHGGGHVSGGGHSGMAAHSGFSGHSGGQAFGGTHSGSGFAARPSARGAFHPPISSRGFNHFGGPRLRAYGFRNNCYGYGCRGGYGYPYLGGGVDPYWWWDSGSSYDPGQQYETGLANEMNAQSLEEQRMRQQNDQDLYAQSAPPPPREHQEEVTELAPATVLVFRDEHRQDIHNYAIVGQTLWNFNPQHTQKIPLSDLDLPATIKENDERGVDFRVPGAGEGQ